MNASSPTRTSARPFAPVRAWRIHLGAHKTATTHLQQTLAAIRPRLAAAGVDFVPLEPVRESGLARALIQRRLLARLPLARDPLARRLIAGFMEPLRAGPDTLVVSEEKLVGTPRQIFEEPPYPAIERAVPMLDALSGRAELTLFLSIRGFHTQLPSAYAHELRHLPPPEGGFDAIRARVRARPPSWFDLVARLRRAAPRATLRVWCQEDYRAHREGIVAALCGCDPGPLPDLPDPRHTKSPSAAAVGRAETLPRDLKGRARQERVREIYAAADPAEPRFAPFSREDRRLLAAAYAEDLARIAALGPEVLLRF